MMGLRQWNYGRLCFVTLLLAVLLAGTVLAPAIAADQTGEIAVSSETPAMMPDMADAGDESFGDLESFDDFEEFDDDADKTVFDPLGGYNRVMTIVNDRLYFWVLKPVARGYRGVVAEPARESIGNFFRNLGFPVRVVNNLLQLKFKRAGTETARFVVNTTVGVAGLWDPATILMDLPAYPEDLGQTLGHYGLGGGFHVVLPLFGPSNVRDVFGKVGDWFLDPVNYLEDDEARAAINALETVNQTSLRIGLYEAITKDAVDKYILLRDGYQDRRNKAIEE